MACIEVVVKGEDAWYKCKTAVDQKSSAYLCTEWLAKKLNLASTPFETTFNVAAGSYVVKGKRIRQTKVYFKDMANVVTVDNLLTVKSIPISIQSVFTSSDIEGLQHLKGVEISQCSNGDSIDLLIGSGVPKAFHQIEHR